MVLHSRQPGFWRARQKVGMLAAVQVLKGSCKQSRYTPPTLELPPGLDEKYNSVKFKFGLFLVCHSRANLLYYLTDFFHDSQWLRTVPEQKSGFCHNFVHPGEVTQNFIYLGFLICKNEEIIVKTSQECYWDEDRFNACKAPFAVPGTSKCYSL